MVDDKLVALTVSFVQSILGKTSLNWQMEFILKNNGLLSTNIYMYAYIYDYQTVYNLRIIN